MILCICSNLRERDVDRALDQGAETSASVFRALGATPQCGMCVRDICDRVASRRVESAMCEAALC